MKGWHQWRTLSAGCHVAAAKICHHSDTCQLCLQRRIVELNVVTRPAGLIARTLRQMPDGLSMRAYGFNLRS